jgi:hypothetical protein
MSLLSVPGRIAWKDARLFDAFPCPLLPCSLFDKPREIARDVFARARPYVVVFMERVIALRQRP